MAVNLRSVIYLRTVASPCSHRQQIGPMAESNAERGALKSLAASGTRMVITGQNGTGLAVGSNVELFPDSRCRRFARHAPAILRRQPQDPSMGASGDFAPAEGGEVVGNIWIDSTSCEEFQTRTNTGVNNTCSPRTVQPSNRAFDRPRVEKWDGDIYRESSCLSSV
jgi:hypothetical protein